MHICGGKGVSHTGGVLRIQNENFIKWPAAVSNELVAFRRITTATPANDEGGIVKKHETQGTHRLVRCCVEHENTAHLRNDAARCRRYESGRSFNLDDTHIARAAQRQTNGRGADDLREKVKFVCSKKRR